MIPHAKALLAASFILILGTACRSSGVESASASNNSTSTPPCTPQIVPMFTANWTPLPAANRVTVSAEVQAARDRLLGVNSTDPTQVKLWWYGVASFVASAGGHLFLFDAWEIVGAHENYSPMSREDLAALKPEAIFIGHGHFDHAGDLGYVAGRTGALVVGGEATCATARQQAMRDNLQAAFSCLVLGNATTPEIGTVQRVQVWEDLPPLSVLRHTHSNQDATDLAAGGTPLIFTPEFLVYLQNLNTSPMEYQWFLESLDDESGNTPAGGTWAYHLQVGSFTLLWHDSAGPIADGKLKAKEIQCALNTFPQCVDVQVGTIVGFGAVTSGLRDVGLYVRNAHPKVSLPNHHDAWAPGVGPGDESYEPQWRAEVASMPNPPQLDYLKDPEDYLRVRSYAVNDPVWIAPMAGSSCAAP